MGAKETVQVAVSRHQPATYKVPEVEVPSERKNFFRKDHIFQKMFRPNEMLESRPKNHLRTVIYGSV